MNIPFLSTQSSSDLRSETLIQRKWRHLKHRIIYRLGGTPNEKIPQSSFHNMSDMLAGLRRRGQEIATVIDVGASDGRWSLQAMTEYPQATYLLLEPNEYHFPSLKTFCREHPQASHVPCVAGRSVGRLAFDDSDPLGGLASENSSGATFPATSIDHEISVRHLCGPYLIKLDTHGFEVPILEGAQNTLKDTAALIIECYPRSLGGIGIPFWEMATRLRKQGFQCVDIADPLYRNRDGAFWQMDMLFVHHNRPECVDNRYV